mgnify:CR=1 FL=1
MSTLAEASRRLEAAVTQLETALQHAPAGAAAARELRLLEAECSSLRQALDLAEQRNRRLAEAADEVALRLDRAIAELTDIVEG